MCTVGSFEHGGNCNVSAVDHSVDLLWVTLAVTSQLLQDKQDQCCSGLFQAEFTGERKQLIQDSGVACFSDGLVLQSASQVVLSWL